MSRRKRPSKDDTEARKKRVRSFRSRERRQQRKQQANDASDLSWLTRSGAVMASMKILNFKTGSETPYWLSIDKDAKPAGSADFYPARSFEHKGRIWYGFVFREHRDAQCDLWPDARKELTPTPD